MLRQFLILSFALCLSTPLWSQQVKAKAENKKVTTLKIEKDIKRFQSKLKNVARLDAKSKAQLAEAYSNWVDQVDEAFHTPKRAKNKNQTITALKENKKEL